MNKDDKKFAIWYGLLLCTFTSLVTAGLVFANDHAGFDIATGYGLPHINNVYVLNDRGNYTVFYGGEKASLGSNINLGIPDGQCKALSLNTDPITRHVTFRLDDVDRSFCE